MLILPQSCNFVIYPTIISFRTDIFFQVFVLLLIFLFVSFNSKNIAVSDDDASPKIVP